MFMDKSSHFTIQDIFITSVNYFPVIIRGLGETQYEPLLSSFNVQINHHMHEKPDFCIKKTSHFVASWLCLPSFLVFRKYIDEEY